MTTNTLGHKRIWLALFATALLTRVAAADDLPTDADTAEAEEAAAAELTTTADEAIELAAEEALAAVTAENKEQLDLRLADHTLVSTAALPL